MKSLLLLLACSTAMPAFAADDIVGGPNGGRLLDTTPLKTEFRVTDDRRVEIGFYGAALQPIAPTTQVVTVIAEAPAGRTPLALEQTAGGFVSKTPLPEAAAPYRVVVQVREAPGAKPQNFRIDLNLAHCAECDRSEYACVCESH